MPSGGAASGAPGSGGSGNGSSPEPDPEPDPGAGARYSTGLPPEQTLPELSDDEFDQLCSSWEVYLSERFHGDLVSAYCRFVAVSLVGFVMPENDRSLLEQCELAFEQCVTSPPGVMNGPIQQCPSRGGSCSATVADYERCTADSVDALGSSWDTLPACGEFGLVDLPIRIEAAATPASCLSYYQKCPGG